MKADGLAAVPRQLPSRGLALTRCSPDPAGPSPEPQQLLLFLHC